MNSFRSGGIRSAQRLRGEGGGGGVIYVFMTQRQYICRKLNNNSRFW